ncbi:MAG: hypothetical protein NTX61_07250 [Bacteroidetes bacterium]|nr:hypothetical protein [Bacteroidota bacterium]
MPKHKRPHPNKLTIIPQISNIICSLRSPLKKAPAPARKQPMAILAARKEGTKISMIIKKMVTINQMCHASIEKKLKQSVPRKIEILAFKWLHFGTIHT